MKIVFLVVLCIVASWAAPMDFSLIKKGDGEGKTILIIGGIQGDEPGGFTAASLLATHYDFKKGRVWIVPNLNFESIIKRSRGVHGDMNRKFKDLSKKDPEFEIVEKVKKLILNHEVDIIVNLHDGSGFYRKKWISKDKNPYKWGQTSIIDQKVLKGVEFGNLEEISSFVVKKVNEKSINKEYNYRINNTKTAEGNVEMAKSLTWFAVKNKKPAFGNEASKNFPTHLRAFYHLLAVEAFLDYMKIGYSRDFDLAPKKVKLAIDDNVTLNINDKTALDVGDSKSRISYFPLKKGKKQKIVSNNPLVTVLPKGKYYTVHYGNRKMSYLIPEYFEFDDSLDRCLVYVDGKATEVKFGSTVDVKREFSVIAKEGYRANVIGFSKKNKKNESGFVVGKKDIAKRFSIDKSGLIYRIEIYKIKENKFAGMILVRFSQRGKTQG